MNNRFAIHHYPFNSAIESELIQKHREYLSWPIVYFLNNAKTQEAYVGETTDVISRLKTHSKNTKKQNLSSVHLVLSEFFNKSAALDLESNLIRYIAADGKYRLQNGNLGISDHRFYQQKEVYWDIFKDIWSELRSLGIARHSLEHIDNSDLFKYSPYKSLSRDQIDGLKMILKCLLDDNAKTSLIQGGAGTGKSIVAIFLFKLLKTNLEDFSYADFDEQDVELFELVTAVKKKYGDPSMALVIPMASFRKTISKVFRNIKGLSSSMVIGPADLASKEYDFVIVDEGHRLRRRVNLGPYFKTFDKVSEKFGFDNLTTSELDWVLKQSKKCLVFYDRYQSIKPSDVLRERFVELENDPTTRIEVLKTQFRSKGGINYVDFVHKLLDGNSHSLKPFVSPDYDLRLFPNLEEMVDHIKLKESVEGLSRMIAGYAWPWLSKTDKTKFDIEIGDTKLRWNSVAIDWINSPNSINEVGCIHTTQGYDLKYSAIIIGPEIDYDFGKKELIVYKDKYKDKAGKNTISDPEVLKDFIINIYKTILLRATEGTYIYVCNENMRRYLAQFIPGFKDVKQKPELRILEEPNERTIPFYDLKAAAGSFSDQQKVEKTKFVELEDRKYDPKNYFACTVIGESMNKIIPNGSVCLFEKYDGGSRNGRIVLVEMIDYTDSETGSNYTVKEYTSKKPMSEESWEHKEITLLPRSTEEYEPIVLRDEETVRLSVVGLFVRVL